MPISYEKAPELKPIVAAMMAAYHNELVDLEVAVAVTRAYKLDSEGNATDGPPLKMHGHACSAKVKVLSAQQRCHVDFDVEIIVDGALFDTLTARQKNAIIDHELEHLVVVRDKEGVPKAHPSGRPQLKCKPDDFAVLGFFNIAARHQEHSVEVQSYNGLRNSMSAAGVLSATRQVVGTALNSAVTGTASLELTAVTTG